MNQRIASIFGVLNHLVESKIYSLMENDDPIAKATNSQDPDELHKLHTHENHKVREAVAANPIARQDTLDAMKNDEHHSVTSSLASNPNISANTMEHLYHLKGHKQEIQANPAIGLHRLDNPHFMSDQHTHEKDFIKAGNQAIDSYDPMELHKASDHEDSSVRFSVAGNRLTHDTTLRKLANDPDELVRARVASNPKTSIDTLRKIHKDGGDNIPDMHVHSLTLNRNTPKDILQSIHKTVQGRIKNARPRSMDQDTQESRLDQITRHPNW